ncbi:UNVERIFIED_CONTAM: Transcription repressor OFP13 [Sesamum radiatum]|uniref:Transcription repressor n=1 Tax=Sesamum radiatum TaxID=300843 RepID=A0AAW2JZM4_SESRA
MAIALMQAPQDPFLPSGNDVRRRLQDRQLRLPRHLHRRPGNPRDPGILVHQLLGVREHLLGRRALDDNNNFESPSLEAIMQGVRSSERLFFEPGETSSILKEPEISGRAALLPFKESVALALESDDPYLDFKKSMQEMVESHGLKEWDCLEELLGWYLRMNGKNNHGFIVGAFVDLLVGMANDHHHQHRCNDSSGSSMAVCCSDTSTTSYSSAGSCFDSPTSPRSPTGGEMVGDGDQMGIDDAGVVVGQP